MIRDCSSGTGTVGTGRSGIGSSETGTIWKVDHEQLAQEQVLLGKVDHGQLAQDQIRREQDVAKLRNR